MPRNKELKINIKKKKSRACFTRINTMEGEGSLLRINRNRLGDGGWWMGGGGRLGTNSPAGGGSGWGNQQERRMQ